MAANKTVMMAVAGAGALGAAYYALNSRTRSASPPSSSNMPDNKARDKRDMGLSGAGTLASVLDGEGRGRTDSAFSEQESRRFYQGTMGNYSDIRQLVQQLYRLARARDPRRRAHAACLEVVAAGAEELVTHVQRVLALDGGARRRRRA
ncbi:hypothetical protein LLEC1_07956, partial [Akanthomyces lecanii]